MVGALAGPAEALGPCGPPRASRPAAGDSALGGRTTASMTRNPLLCRGLQAETHGQVCGGWRVN